MTKWFIRRIVRSYVVSYFLNQWWPISLCRLQWVNLLRTSDAYMRQWNRPSLVQIMACQRLGTKSSSQPKLVIFNWNLRNKLQWNSNRNSNIFIRKNAFENIVHENGGHLVSSSMCLSHQRYPLPILRNEPTFHYIDVIMSAMASQKPQPHDCLFNCLLRCTSKKTSKLHVTGLVCAGNSLVTCEFPAQRDSNAENVSIWWRHHVCIDIRYINVNEFTIIWARTTDNGPYW